MTIDQIIDEEFTDRMLDNLYESELKNIKDAMETYAKERTKEQLRILLTELKAKELLNNPNGGKIRDCFELFFKNLK